MSNPESRAGVPRPSPTLRFPDAVLDFTNFDHSPIPMWIFEIKSLGFLAVNDAAIRHYGFSRDEFLSMTILDIRPHEDIVPLLREEFREARRNSEREQWRHLKKDGTSIAVEITSREIIFNGRKAELVRAIDVSSRLGSPPGGSHARNEASTEKK